MKPIAVAVLCKTPAAGKSKTRLSPPLRPEECAAISACFIRDLAQTIQSLVDDGDAGACAVYTPAGSEDDLRRLLPRGFQLTLQSEGDLGKRLLKGTADLLEQGFAGAILINSDSPTLPKSILRAAVDAVRLGDNVVLSPAFDGGYTLIGLSQPHARLFEDMPWSTSEVYRLTVQRAGEIGLPVVNVPGWYDVDDAASFAMLQDELNGIPPSFAAPDLIGASAPATFQFISERHNALLRV
ncbi:MAG TPA: TIGR04282 family arsenosugar biosynthesis glycosyltransferase [Pseudolabrys sp.]|nr:TIGR04282 family arsenosugar biosynthesis glycosyltransferase [Pseudolabrys sp.]